MRPSIRIEILNRQLFIWFAEDKLRRRECGLQITNDAGVWHALSGPDEWYFEVQKRSLKKKSK